MLDLFQREIRQQGLPNIELAQADVLRPDTLPAGWRGYDLIVASALLEHIPENQISTAVSNLKDRLKAGGVLLLFLTRRNLITALTGKLFWKTNLFEETAVKTMLARLGFDQVESKRLPSRWANHIIVVEARK